MNRNSNAHFANVPSIDHPRSRFEINFNHKTSFNTGSLIPIFADEVLAGDSITMDMGAVIRMSTPIFPVLDNAFLDVLFFNCPNRLVWEHWKEFLGENNTSYWEQETEYAVPHIKAPEGGWEKGTIADYFGIPTKVPNLSVSALPFRAYCEIWNNWWRDQNLKQPALVNKDDADQIGENHPAEVTDASYVTNAQLGGSPLKAARMHTMLSSSLPQPQKGPDVLIPLGGVSGVLPVVTVEGMNNAYNGEPMRMAWNKEWTPTGNQGLLMASLSPYNLSEELSGAVMSNTAAGYNAANDKLMSPSNLGVIAGTNNQNDSTINQLRMAFAMQRFYEQLARGGSRYREILQNMFNVTTSDKTMQIPEYIGGFRKPINVDQVLQTSATNEVSPQGNTGAFSHTSFSEHCFTKSFEEHGWIIGVAVIRTEHSNQQGLDRRFSRRNKFDFYWPVLQGIGEQPVLYKEVYATGTEQDEEVWGYQESFFDYRWHPSVITGAMRSNYEQSLDAWHYADYYTEQPVLSSGWIDEPMTNVDRTLAISSQVEDQFLADFQFNGYYTRMMPIYSVPGMIDHY